MGKVKQALEQDMLLNPENYNNPDPTEEEMRKLYEEDPALWLKLFSGGKYGKKPKKD